MKLIIIGASGYLGRELYNNVPEHLLKYGTSSRECKELINLNLLRVSDFDFSQIEPLDVVIVTAANSSPDYCATQFEAAWQLNIEGTSTFIKKSVERGARIIFCSSDTIYGETTKVITEQSIIAPVGEYAKMKREIESRFESNANFKAIRLSNIFSIQDKFTKFLISCSTQNLDAEIFQPFDRSIIYRQDVVDGIIALAINWNDHKENIINFGGPSTISRVDVATLIKQLALPSLQLKIVNPPENFFTNRPKVINMESPLLGKILGRNPTSIAHAILKEFN